MIQIVWWGLANPRYAHMPGVGDGRRALVRQAAWLEREVWRTSGQICENFCPGDGGNASRPEAKCCGGTFYHWCGAHGCNIARCYGLKILLLLY